MLSLWEIFLRGEVSARQAFSERSIGVGNTSQLNQHEVSCPVNSFSADTEVSTPEGFIPIAEIDIGDTVFAYNEETGITGEYTVTDTMQHEDDAIVTLTVNGEEIETTPWHKFYTDEGWVEAEDLAIGDNLLSLGGVYGEVESILIEDRTQTMYDLTIEEVHTFAVGEGEWVVHNECRVSPFTDDWFKKGAHAHASNSAPSRPGKPIEISFRPGQGNEIVLEPTFAYSPRDVPALTQAMNEINDALNNNSNFVNRLIDHTTAARDAASFQANPTFRGRGAEFNFLLNILRSGNFTVRFKW